MSDDQRKPGVGADLVSARDASAQDRRQPDENNASGRNDAETLRTLMQRLLERRSERTS